MYSHSPLLQSVFHHAEIVPDKTAIVVGNIEVSYSLLALNARKAASLLDGLGLRPSDRIILSAHKDIEFIYLYLGAHILGVTNVIVDAESNKERLNYIEDKTNPLWCFGYESSKHRSMQFAEIDIEALQPYSGVSDNLSVDDIAEVLFTTGTTGAPKGVCLSYGNIAGSASNINSFIKNEATDIEVLGLPICHSFGLGRIRCNLMMGATIVILGSFANVRLFFKTIERYHATGFGVVPAAWAYIRKISGTRIGKYASQIKYIEIGSAAMPLETKKEMLNLFPNTRICMHYGLTEASRNCFQEFHDIEHLDSIGKPVCENVDVQIFSPEGSVLPDGEKGELCVKGNMVLSRYLEEKDNKNDFYGEYFLTGE